MKRLILHTASQCPFCGCQKIFLKAVTVKWSDFDPVTRKWSSGYRIKAAGQCAKCHIRGPFVYSEPKSHRQDPDDELIAKVIEKWNTRDGKTKVKVEDKGAQVPTCERKGVPIYECAYFEYEYDDLGKYCWCHNRESGRRECNCGYIYAQQFCPFYKKGDLRGKSDIGQPEIEAAERFKKEWSMR